MPSNNPDISYFAQTNFRNEKKLFGIQQKDRMFHVYALGQTGVGKSTMLATLMKQDIIHQRGFALIEPHSDLVNTILKSIPESEQHRLIYLDATDPSLTLGYNPIKRVSFEKRALVASGILDVLKKLWKDAWGMKLEHILRYTLLALLDQPKAHLGNILDMLLDKHYRRGRPKKYDGKVNFKNLNRFDKHLFDEENMLYSKILYSVSLSRRIKVVVLKNKESGSYRVFFATDVSMTAKEIFIYYSSRFQIEFLFRDAKQHTGLNHCQSTKKERSNFHHNASLTTINFIKAKLIEDNKYQKPEAYPIQQTKRKFELAVAIRQVVDEFDIPKELITLHPNFKKFKNLNFAA